MRGTSPSISATGYWSTLAIPWRTKMTLSGRYVPGWAWWRPWANSTPACKSRLVQVLREQVATEPQAWLTPCQCSPYHQNSALYPMIELLERVALRFEREESS